MKYFEVEFTISPYSADASDVLAAMAGEAGFETFEETETGLKGYVQQSLFDVSVLNAALEDFPFEDTTVSYDIQEAEDRDWNEQWEQEGFEPIVISGEWREERGERCPKRSRRVEHIILVVSWVPVPKANFASISIEVSCEE